MGEVFPSGAQPRCYLEKMSEETSEPVDELHEQRIKRLEARLQELEKTLHEVGHQLKSLQNGARDIKWDQQYGTLGSRLKNIADYGRTDL